MQPDIIGGRYRTRHVIGRGGMGAVWLAQDETLGREVAVKQVGLLPGETVPSSARALREARATAALSHRNVVTVYDVIEEGESIWLVMEHVPSRSLAQIIAEDGPLEPDEAARIGVQVADGLAAAHAAGIEHRDVKPGNVLVREDGVAKISDFGIARPDGDPALTQTGMFVGTPAYLSPEAARGETSTPASDVWSLGATLYAAVEGSPPYDTSGNQLAVLSRIAEQEPPPPRLAGDLAPALSRMLDRNPASRWSMADAAHALRRVADASATHTLAVTRADEDDHAGAGVLPAAGAGAGAAAAGAAGAGAAGAATTTAHRGSSAQATPARPDPVRDPEDDRRSRRPGPVLVGLVALVAAMVAALFLLDLDGSDEAPSAGDPATTPSVTEEPPPEETGRDESPQPTTQEPSEETDSEQAEPSPEPSGSSNDAAGAAEFIRQYFDTVPDDTDAGWSMLGPGMRSSVDRDSYEGWWNTVEDVQVSEIDPADSGEAADVTLTYSMKDGRQETERHRLDLLRGDGGWLINGDQAV